MGPIDENKLPDQERSAEEIAWDEEFAQTSENSDFASTIGNLLSLAVKIPVAIIQMPINMLPSETRQHARAAVREGFLAARSLLATVADGVEGMLSDPTTGPAPVSGPPGTWGTARSAQAGMKSTPTPSKAKRIEIDDNEETPSGEGRGLRADIDY